MNQTNRVFLVGCSRSGTSVVQSLLACHPQVQSFPESDYFTKITRNTRRRHLLQVGLATGREQAHLGGWLRTIGQPALASEIIPQPVRFAPAVRSFIGALDQITENAGRTIWLEKTPLHVLHLDLIERYVPDATVLHLVRDGREVVASLYDRATKNERQFGDQLDVDVCADLWNQCVDETLAHVGKSRHHVVTYERAVADPLHVANQVGGLLGIEYTREDLDRRGRAAGDYVLSSETWKGGVSKPIRPQGSKFESVLSAEQRQRVESRLRLSDYDAAAAVALS